MARSDQEHWDGRYATADAPAGAGQLPAAFKGHEDLFTDVSSAVEIACGAGRASVWLAEQGARVTGYDISPVAIDRARLLAEHNGVSELCTFVAVDLDHGLPDGEPVDLVLCNMFREARLDLAVMDRLRPGGLLAIAALSEVGASPGRFRCRQGELTKAFASLEFIDHGEGDGVAWLLARTV